MEFTSVSFMIFVFVIAVLNYSLPNFLRVACLLFGSLIFYYLNCKNFFVLLIILCLLTYASGIIIGVYKKRVVYFIGVFAILSSLIYFKYFDFLVETINRFIIISDVSSKVFSVKNLIGPIGISFMSFQSVSYLGDIYYGKISAEKNPAIVAIQVCFFPNVISGPIQKAKDFIPQIKEKIVFNYYLVKSGTMLFAFGALQKFFISDKLAPLVESMQSDIIEDPLNSGFHGVLFAFVYSLYIYSNFNSYSDMAIGIARILGIRFKDNFKRPYLSLSVRDFWRRWHISLNSWFIEYVYIPLGGSRKGKMRYYINILIIFLLSGVWHGAGAHFIAWGLLNGLYLIIGDVTINLRKRILRFDNDNFFVMLWKRFFVFCLISLSWIFFAVPSVKGSVHIIVSALNCSAKTFADGWFVSQFSSIPYAALLIMALIIFFKIQIIREKNSIESILAKQPVLIRFAIYIAAGTLLLFGFCGTFIGAGNGGFIYGNF